MKNQVPGRLPPMVAVCSILATAHAGADVFEGVGQAIAIPSPTSVTAGDFDRDGKADLAVTLGRNEIAIIFQDPGGPSMWTKSFLEVGNGSFFVRAADLDGDGDCDLTVADPGTTLYLIASNGTILFWSTGDRRMLEASASFALPSTAKSLAIADLDIDGTPDILIPDAREPRVFVCLSPGTSRFPAAFLTIETQRVYSRLEVIDLDSDGVPDLLGVDPAAGLVQVALLSPDGKVRSEVTLPTDRMPSLAAAGRIDGDPAIDLAVPCAGSQTLVLFQNRGEGRFSAEATAPTVRLPKKAILADLDSDGLTDMVVAFGVAWRTLQEFLLGESDWGRIATGVLLGPERILSDWAQGIILGWISWGFVDEEGDRGVDRWIRARRDSLRTERQWVDVLRDTWLSLFRVTAVKLDIGLELEDLLAGKRLFVRERSGTHDMYEGQVILGWIATFPEHDEMTGAMIEVPASLAGEAERILRGAGGLELGRDISPADRMRMAAGIPAILKAMTGVIPDPQAEERRAVTWEAVYEVRSAERLRTRLPECPDLIAVEPDRDQAVRSS